MSASLHKSKVLRLPEYLRSSVQYLLLRSLEFLAMRQDTKLVPKFVLVAEHGVVLSIVSGTDHGAS